jgi:putative transposase
VRLRTKVTKAPDPGPPGWHGAQAAESRPGPLAAVISQHLVALVRAGATFTKGVLVERPTEATQQEQEKVTA